MRILKLYLLLSVATLSAAPLDPTYPTTVRAFDKLSFKRIPQKELPNGVYFWTSQGAESNEDPNLEGNVSYLDINGDGANEIIVESPCKHADQYEIWQNRKGRWISLLTVWGRPDFLHKRNGYYQVTVWNQGRNGEGTRELYTFEGARYHATRIDHYQDDVFVRTLDAHDRENVLEHNFKEQFRK